LRRRLAQAPRPYSTIESEARAVGIPVDVLLVTANALGVKGREVGNGNPLRIGNERRERAQGDHKNPPPFWLRRNRLHG
jgi:hypothetical protein